MTGKFNNSRNKVCFAYCIIVPLVIIFGGAALVVNMNALILGPFIILGLAALAIWLGLPLRKCEFSADAEKIVFREAFLKHIYLFSEIKSATTEVGFSHGRYGSSARVELVIALSDGESVTFYDEDVPDDALSTPEKHKKFKDTHQFTALCQYINERASG